MKRTGFKPKPRKPMKRTRIKKKSRTPNAVAKDDIQAILRAIVTIRDGGCVLRDVQGTEIAGVKIPMCNGFRNDGELILQADHLISRANSATYADERLVVCVCKGHHGWKSVGNNLRKEGYDEVLKMILPEDRVELWKVCAGDKTAHRMGLYDWKLAKTALSQTLERLKANK